MYGLNPKAAEAYFRHTVDGVPINRIAADIGDTTWPSTVSRRIRRVEDLTECPVWAEIVETVSTSLQTRPGPPWMTGSYSHRELLWHLGTTFPQVGRAAVDARRQGPADVVILLGSVEAHAAIMVGDAVHARIARPQALGLVLTGHAIRDPDRSSARLARLVMTRTPRADMLAAPCRFHGTLRIPRSEAALPQRSDLLLHYISALATRGLLDLDTRHVAATRSLIEMADTSPERLRADIRSLDLPPRYQDFILAVFLDGILVERAERAAGIPARSGKLLLALILHRVADTPDPAA